MIPAIIIEVDVVLVFHLLRQILYPGGRPAMGWRVELERSRKPRAIFGVHNETIDSIEYVVLMSSHLPC